MSRPAFGRAEVLVSSPTKRKKKNKPRVKLDPRTPTAARLKNGEMPKSLGFIIHVGALYYLVWMSLDLFELVLAHWVGLYY